MSSCSEESNSNTIREVAYFKDYNWSSQTSKSFRFYPSDTTSKGDIRLTLRYLRELIHSPIRLEIRATNNPEKSYFRDTVDISLASGGGSYVRDMQLTLMEDIVWQSDDLHTIYFRPLNNLDGMVSLNIEIDNAKEQKDRVE